ncbi:hypothetical protein DENSPDRAFT_204290 [Dentipellis sp. KUC8613]|nr:hypothetical protein DENSPDRAFT_204290 [Dentipellis sp. KUC8613]
MDTLLATSDSVRLSARRERSPSDPEDATHGVATKPVPKRLKAADSSDLLTPTANTVVSMPPLGPALKIKNAIERAGRLDSIGHCTTKISESERRHSYVYDRHDEVEERRDKRMSEPERHNEHIVTRLTRIYEYGPSVNAGMLDKPFRLTVTHPGCEVELGSPFPEDTRSEGEKQVLERLFEHSAVAGYGDVQTQETKVDQAVRNAREIPASGFSVSPELLEEIQMHWGKYFRPARVRAEPYKIHIYGKDGHFKSHRDTPAKGLVGTFLVGLGDTTYGRHLQVGPHTFGAYLGRWVAFYPDVPHCVTKIGRGHRAVVAFKIFSEDTEQAEDVDEALVRLIGPCVSEMKAPFGLFLRRKYCMGTQQLSGTDAALLTSLNRLDGVRVYLVPIVTKFSASRVLNDYGRDEVDAGVYPFTMAHVEYLNGACSKDDKTALDDLLNSSSFDWLKRMGEDIPFYYTDLEDTAITWNDDWVETENHVGNEVDAWREDSTYLSYAVVVLPISRIAGETASSSS